MATGGEAGPAGAGVLRVDAYRADRVLPLPVGDGELRHGFMVSEVNRLAVGAVGAVRRFRGLAPHVFPHQVEIAHHAMIVRLYSSETAPEANELIAVAWRALTEDGEKAARFKGYRPYRWDQGRIPAFDRFWTSAAAPTSGPEERVVERIAVGQILARLPPRLREVVVALAEHGTYAEAAEATGFSVASFTATLSRARREFLALWHEGESPSRIWAQDKRRSADAATSEPVIYAVLRRRKRAQQLRPSGRPPRRRAGRRVIDLGVSAQELARRYESETLAELARSLGVSVTTVQRRMEAAGIERRKHTGPQRKQAASPVEVRAGRETREAG